MQPTIRMDNAGDSRLRYVFPNLFNLAPNTTFEVIADDKRQAPINLIRERPCRIKVEGKDGTVADPEVVFPFHAKSTLVH
jgi:hypothetical protein